jgi:hypothetical protein
MGNATDKRQQEKFQKEINRPFEKMYFTVTTYFLHRYRDESTRRVNKKRIVNVEFEELTEMLRCYPTTAWQYDICDFEDTGMGYKVKFKANSNYAKWRFSQDGDYYLEVETVYDFESKVRPSPTRPSVDVEKEMFINLLRKGGFDLHKSCGW